MPVIVPLHFQEDLPIHYCHENGVVRSYYLLRMRMLVLRLLVLVQPMAVQNLHQLRVNAVLVDVYLFSSAILPSIY